MGVTRLDALVYALPAAAASVGESGHTLLGWLKGLAVALAVVGVLIIAGKMAAGHLRGDGRQAAEGLSELPWVLLALVLMSSATAITLHLLAPADVHSSRPTSVIEEFERAVPEKAEENE